MLKYIDFAPKHETTLRYTFCGCKSFLRNKKVKPSLGFYYNLSASKVCVNERRNKVQVKEWLEAIPANTLSRVLVKPEIRSHNPDMGSLFIRLLSSETELFGILPPMCVSHCDAGSPLQRNISIFCVAPYLSLYMKFPPAVSI